MQCGRATPTHTRMPGSQQAALQDSQSEDFLTVDGPRGNSVALGFLFSISFRNCLNYLFMAWVLRARQRRDGAIDEDILTQRAVESRGKRVALPRRRPEGVSLIGECDGGMEGEAGGSKTWTSKLEPACSKRTTTHSAAQHMHARRAPGTNNSPRH